MRFNKEMILATELLIRVPLKAVSAKRFAESLGTTEFFLQRIVGKLRKADLVKVKKGPEGGVFRNPDRADCTVLDVYKALGQEPSDVETGSFFAGLQTNILDLMGATTVPYLGPETEDGQAREGA